MAEENQNNSQIPTSSQSENPPTSGPKPGTCSEPGGYDRGTIDNYETGQRFLDNIQTKNL